MSGIYIPGMEMPTSCWDCELGSAQQLDGSPCPFYSADYREQKKYSDKRADGCPLIPVPDHGRLIDADALPTYDKPIGKMMMFGGEYVYTQTAIDNAPTIIPASREGEK